MIDTIKTDIRALFLEREDCDAGTVQQLRNGLSQGAAQYKSLREAVDVMRTRHDTSSGAAAKKWQLKIGIASYFLGRIKDAVAALKEAEGALAAFYLARAQISLNDHEAALKALDKAEKSGYTASQVNLYRAGVHRQQGHVKQARDLLNKLQDQASHSGEYHYQLGSIQLEEGARAEALKHFERAIELDPGHTGALFQLGCANDLAGNDKEAIDLLERCVQQLPAHVGATINLGILYEDNNQYEKAVQCFQRVSSANPADDRARLFLKDAMASRSMFYDEEAEKSYDKFAQVLEVPVTDFELSVRARNCLKRMNIRTLGDLTRVTEAQLLASKNFGETSLQEIREMMTSRNLHVGQALEEGARYDPRFRPVQQPLSEQEQATLNKSVGELNLSVRARKCMNKLGIASLGDLINYTADQLLEVKNFGMTSLSEVREKLVQYGLKLRGD
jgi:DNA-directed RNA polymerase subunit alpha